jgi:hypothetical protein
MDSTALLTAIANFVFPIVVAAFLLIRTDGKMQKASCTIADQAWVTEKLKTLSGQAMDLPRFSSPEAIGKTFHYLTIFPAPAYNQVVEHFAHGRERTECPETTMRWRSACGKWPMNCGPIPN